MDIQVDPNLVNQAYKQMLGEVQDRLQNQVVMLQAACTQLQSQLETATSEVEELKTENARLRAETGRQDGVPQDEDQSFDGA